MSSFIRGCANCGVHRPFRIATAFLLAGLALPDVALAARSSTAELTITLSVQHECSVIEDFCFVGGSSSFRNPQFVAGSSAATPFATADQGYSFDGGLIFEDRQYKTLTFRTSATAGPAPGVAASAEAHLDWIPDPYMDPDAPESLWRYVGFLELDSVDLGDTGPGWVSFEWDALITNSGGGQGHSSIFGEFMVTYTDIGFYEEYYGIPQGNYHRRFLVDLSSSSGVAMASGGSVFHFIEEESEDDLFYGAWSVFYREFSMSSYAAIPEPATWAAMIAGFGVVGAAARRRRATYA